MSFILSGRLISLRGCSLFSLDTFVALAGVAPSFAGADYTDTYIKTETSSDLLNAMEYASGACFALFKLVHSSK